MLALELEPQVARERGQRRVIEMPCAIALVVRALMTKTFLLECVAPLTHFLEFVPSFALAPFSAPFLLGETLCKVWSPRCGSKQERGM